jgi:GNAT superfamily N-acetyltransferase
MPLPILNVLNTPSAADLVRYFHRTALHWARHVGDESVLDFGTAFTNAQLAGAPYFNQMLDALVPAGMNAAEVIAAAEQHFRETARVACRRWVLAPSAPEEQTRPLREALQSREYQRSAFDILYLGHQPTGSIESVGNLTVIPGRASYRHVRELAEEWAAEEKTPEVAEAMMMHLDGDHTDALLALKDGKPAAMVFVLAVGDIGCIEDVFVSAPFRGQGIGRTMMSRAMEICARSLFKHVFVGVDSSDGPANALYRKFGFQKVGEYVSYVKR